MSLMDKIRSWWSKDELAKGEDETRMTPLERDVAEEDYEGRKDDASQETQYAGSEMVGTDFESDSEPPSPGQPS